MTPLTPRQTEVLVWAAHGLTAKESAQRLFLSESTVKVHRLNATRRLNARSCAHAVAIALREGLLV